MQSPSHERHPLNNIVPELKIQKIPSDDELKSAKEFRQNALKGKDLGSVAIPLTKRTKSFTST